MMLINHDASHDQFVAGSTSHGKARRNESSPSAFISAKHPFLVPPQNWFGSAATSSSSGPRRSSASRMSFEPWADRSQLNEDLVPARSGHGGFALIHITSSLPFRAEHPISLHLFAPLLTANRRPKENIAVVQDATEEFPEPRTWIFSTKRGQPRVLRWRNYQMSELSEYKRVSVLLFVPFRNELVDILDQNKFLQLYDLHEEAILAKRKEYDCELNVEQTVEEYERTLANLEDGEQNNPANEKHDELVRTVIMQPNNDDFELLPTRTLRSVIKQRPNVMSKEDYCAMMRATNREQRALILHTIHLLTCFEDHEPLQVFLTGPAGSGKTFTLRALMETLNRYSQEHNSRDNAYVASASTGKAASAIGGTTLHHAYHITMSRQVTKMSFETLQVYRTEMQRVKAHIIDEISMVGAHILNITHLRLQDVYMNYLLAFGGVDLYLCGDLRQLFPVMAKPVFKPPANSISGAVLWQLLKYHELKQVMRQADKEFSDILTKIGNGDKLTADETKVIESRFFTAERLRQEQTEGARCRQHEPRQGTSE
ncbi:tetratricopeptide repeat protein, tpr [Culex quinquefasciatus]|uniref:ATP-dependent DNA helicase n=1 Tax=Culex quinquefasciatus TaxID=7176 RepID=B0WF40_CULQU|nr:tetratricopeptide repeat protein, tpr [Culex quinquefasciatus]|eukprot:XP_001847324.1 tetratricopeptide repeat protein, tpr [Culex quinquefasciatus]